MTKKSQRLSYAEREAKKYFSKYFKNCYIEKDDIEFKSLVRLINKSIRMSIIQEEKK